MNEKSSLFKIGEFFPFLNADILQDRIGWSVRLRWLAIGGYFVATLIARFFFDFTIPYLKIWFTLGILLLVNFAYFTLQLRVKRFSFVAELSLLSIQIIVDLIFLTILLHFSGGIENPVYFFYLFHVVLSSIVFPRRLPYLFATLALALFVLLTYLEYQGIISHYALFASNLYHNKTAIELVLIVFATTIYVTTYICLTFMQIYRHSKNVIDAQNRKLKQVTRQKLDFFRFASHELKSPLVAIKTSVDTVLATFGKNMDAAAQDLLKRASVRAEQMLTIIKDLLELSKSGEAVDRSKVEPVLPAQVLEEVVAQESVLARAKDITIDLHNDLDALTIKIDKNDLEKVLRNLVNNAVRYTPPKGYIRIDAQVRNDKIVFKIRDTGIGIPKADLAKIFDEFYRAQNARQQISFGSGLGLSLVKKIVESYQGEIEVQSQLNKGTIFTVTFPLIETTK